MEVLDVLEAGDFVIDHSKSDHHNTLQLIVLLISSETENLHNHEDFCPYQSFDNKLINVFQEKSRSIICCISKQNSHASLAFHTCFSFSFCVSQKLLTRSKRIPKILLIQQLLTSNLYCNTNILNGKKNVQVHLPLLIHICTYSCQTFALTKLALGEAILPNTLRNTLKRLKFEF